MNNKSQFTSVDFIFALFVFLIIIIALFFNYGVLGNKISSTDTTQDMNLIFTYATEALMKTTGNPINWNKLSVFNTTEITSLGLATKPGVLSEDKIIYLSSLSGSNYTTAKTLLGILGPGYEFGYNLFLYNGTNYNLKYSFGNANLSSSNVLVSQRNFVLDNASKTFGYVRFYMTK